MCLRSSLCNRLSFLWMLYLLCYFLRHSLRLNLMSWRMLDRGTTIGLLLGFSLLMLYSLILLRLTMLCWFLLRHRNDNRSAVVFDMELRSGVLLMIWLLLLSMWSLWMLWLRLFDLRMRLLLNMRSLW